MVSLGLDGFSWRRREVSQLKHLFIVNLYFVHFVVVFSGDLLHRSPLNVPLVLGVDEVGVRRNIASLLLVLVERIHGCKSVSHPQSSVKSSRQELVF